MGIEKPGKGSTLPTQQQVRLTAKWETDIANTHSFNCSISTFYKHPKGILAAQLPMEMQEENG